MLVFLINKYASDDIKASLASFGRVIELDRNITLNTQECCHPDMQLCKIDDSTAVFAPYTDEKALCKLSSHGIQLIQGSQVLKPEYPLNISYNVLIYKNILIHNTKYTALEILDLFPERICVKQGYSGCSSIVMDDLILTSDPGIASLKFPLKVDFFQGTSRILLKGYDHGFIGGCCGYHRDCGLLVCGRPDGDELEKYSPVYLSDGNIEDFGGIVVFKV